MFIKQFWKMLYIMDQEILNKVNEKDRNEKDKEINEQIKIKIEEEIKGDLE